MIRYNTGDLSIRELIQTNLKQPACQHIPQIIQKRSCSGKDIDVPCPAQFFPLRTVCGDADHIGNRAVFDRLLQTVQQLMIRFKLCQFFDRRSVYKSGQLQDLCLFKAGYPDIPKALVRKMRNKGLLSAGAQVLRFLVFIQAFDIAEIVPFFIKYFPVFQRD